MAKYLGLRGRPLSLAVSATCTIGFLLFGYDQGVMSGLITHPDFLDTFPSTKNNSTMQGLVTALYEIGCLFGAIFVLFFGDIIGRKKGILAGATIMILGTVVQITSFKSGGSSRGGGLAQFIAGRIITGVGNGMNTSSIPTYQAECANTKNRGLLICIQGGIIAFGTLISYWLNYGVSDYPGSFSWRFPIAFQIVFGLMILVGMSILPDSPRWLLSCGRDKEGTEVIAALYGLPVDSHETLLHKRIILESIAASTDVTADGKAHVTPFSELVTNGRTQHFRRMLLGASSQLMQQIGGCNAVIYYFPILFETSIKQTRHTSLVMGGVNMAVYALFATASWFIIERVGRRKLFIWGTLGQMLGMIITFAGLIPGTPNAGKGAAAGLFVYIAAFGASWLPLPWLYPAEVNPLRTRAKANAVSTCTNWAFNFLVVLVTPIMVDRIGWGTYLFFACVNACFLPIIHPLHTTQTFACDNQYDYPLTFNSYFWYPETRKRSLEEIDIIFAKGYCENISYVRAARELPLLTTEEVEEMALRYGAGLDEGRRRVGYTYQEDGAGIESGSGEVVGEVEKVV
ncbi:hypothetical protein Dda_8919 [Drechslerella dactyloides]|uniref:Major facilitator superfamily (MFS) profile domain-containing protein n=1 Tax=Drechslerella dactyloides TaxID=74499 RepID=A0AAD6NH50_DREDA|nr:hypothetical protein Dda_8919 [Drechslerella dactyloides]